MSSAICTLFEGNYHYGVAALTNSLYANGYRGEIYAGYRGSLPTWCDARKLNPAIGWDNASTFNVAQGLVIHFLPLNTEYHLTNYKPEFMLHIWNRCGVRVDSIAYFDPDIVIKCDWMFFERWMSHGVALVHDLTDNDMPQSHPIRLEWKKIISNYSASVKREVNSYINAGFCGVSKEHIDFLHTWQFFIEKAVSDYSMDPRTMTSFHKTHPFCFLDQDALNITAMCSEALISEMGPAGMDFVHGGWTMSHALGSPKPWKKSYLSLALLAQSPSLADKEFWLNTKYPINLFSAIHYKWKKLSILFASFFSRFYSR